MLPVPVLALLTINVKVEAGMLTPDVLQLGAGTVTSEPTLLETWLALCTLAGRLSPRIARVEDRLVFLTLEALDMQLLARFGLRLGKTVMSTGGEGCML